MRDNEKNIHKMGAILQAKKAPEGEVKGAYENSGFSSDRCAAEVMKCDEKKGLTESDVLRALYHMYCAAAIIKALECCKKDDCDNCPNDFGNCYSNLAGYALDLINRQKAEIERLKTRLNIDLENYASEYDRKIKAEAIKEYLVKLNENSFYLRHIDEMADGMVATKVVDMNTIIKVAKEMVGDV